jgi:hypothetical protein
LRALNRVTNPLRFPGARDPALYAIPNGGHDTIFRAARPDFERTTLAFLGG